jgi:pimeloyl-ACP methyl ester carboxylesterase
MTEPPAATPSSTYPLVIVNGLGAPKAAAEAFGMHFRARGFRVSVAPQVAWNFADVRRLARLVADHVERVRADTGAPRVHMVGMSLGGLTGLYYIRCLGGAAAVARFVSMGGPLNGSPLAYLSAAVPFGAMPALAQSRPDSDLIAEIKAAPRPDGVRMYSVGTRGDPITPRESWAFDGFEPVETPHGFFPLGHWCLFVHPGNAKRVEELLLEA